MDTGSGWRGRNRRPGQDIRTGQRQHPERNRHVCGNITCQKARQQRPDCVGAVLDHPVHRGLGQIRIVAVQNELAGGAVRLAQVIQAVGQGVGGQKGEGGRRVGRCDHVPLEDVARMVAQIFVVQAVPVVFHPLPGGGPVLGKFRVEGCLGVLPDEVHPEVVGHQMCEVAQHEAEPGRLRVQRLHVLAVEG